MAKTILNLHTSLAFRLGESAAPTSTTELARRLQWFVDALNSIGTDMPWWFLRKKGAYITVTNKSRYTVPSDYRKIIHMRINDIKFNEIELEDDYSQNKGFSNSVVSLAKFDTAILSGWNFYVLGTEFVVSPQQDAPSAIAITSITSSGTTATVTTTADHGWSDGDYVTISGAVETAYNGQFQITVVTATTFTYECSTTPSATPATGTITATKNNLEIWYYYKPTEPTGSTSSIIVPDEFADALVSYAEGRYWSMAHKRGKAADGFTEHEQWINKLRAENARQKFLAI